MIKAVIIDNKKSSITHLKKQLKKLKSNVDVMGEANSVDDGINLIKSCYPDLLFLNVELVDGTGFDMLEKLSAENLLFFKTIFTSSYDHYAIKAIRCNALDYLTKPIILEELKAAIEKAFQQRSDKNSIISDDNFKENAYKPLNSLKKIAINTNERMLVCSIAEIMRCESKGNYTIIYLQRQGSIMTSKTLKEYEEVLKKEGFLRIHQSHLLNVDHIDSYMKSQDCVMMKDGSSIPVSKSNKQELLRALNHL